jgi:Fic family protein
VANFSSKQTADTSVDSQARTTPNQGAAWPAVAYENLEWKPRIRYAVPAAQSFRQFGRYQAAVIQPIAEISMVPLSPATLTLVAEASAEIARFDEEVGSDIAPFSSILLRSESVASSRIENLTASAKAIALAEAGDTSRENASVIVANTTAMRAAIALADQLDGDAILAMHDALLGPSEPQLAGRWRDEPVWIGGSAYSPHGATFVPPRYEHIPDAITDLTAFMDRLDIPPLVQAAIAHAQFETLHPFPDGNGRTGRALIHSLLRGKGLTRKVTIPVSAGLLADTGAYFAALTSYRQGNPEPIVAMMSEAAFAAVNNGRQLVADLHGVRDGWNSRITARSDAAAWKTADLLLSQPIVDSPMLQRELKVSDYAALAAIKHLTEIGVLAKVSGKQRDRKYAATEILGALDGFAARSGRRGGY